ncbi:MAG: amino acid adenylation domain-containing protein [Myxococcota bacterium]
MSDPDQVQAQRAVLDGPARALSPLTIHQRIIERARAVKSRPALRYIDPGNEVRGERMLTYGELITCAVEIAVQLRRRGHRTGEPVAVMLPPCVELVVAILGVQVTGSPYVPLSPGYSNTRIAAIVDSAAIKWAIVAHEYRAQLPPSVAIVEPDQGLHGHQTEPATHTDDIAQYPGSPHDPAYIIFTSGSTGEPKGVANSHRALGNLVDGLRHAVFRDSERPRRVALVAATVFDASVGQIFAALCAGDTLYLIDDDTKSDPDALIQYLTTHAIEVCDLTPSRFRLLLEAGFAKRTSDYLRWLMIGGEPLWTRDMQRFYAHGRNSAVRALNLYGPTECCVEATWSEVGCDNLPTEAVVPIGRAIQNATTWILDSNGAPCAWGQSGQLYLGGACLGLGYIGPDADQRFCTIRPGGQDIPAFATGDVVRLSADGQLLFIERCDDQVKIRGYRVELGEVEAALRRCNDVRGAAVIKTVEQGDDELWAFVVTDRAMSARALRRELQGLPDYMIPTRFFAVERIPLSSSGKADRNALRAVQGIPLAATGPGSQDSRAPRSRAEEILVAAWTRVLGQSDVSVYDNFFELGGDSIKALRVAAEVHKNHYKLHLKHVFNSPDIESLAAMLIPLDASRAPMSDIGDVPLLPAQQWFFGEYGGDRDHFNQAVLLTTRVTLDPDRIRDALERLIDRHGALRSRFYHTDNRWQARCEAKGEVSFAVVDLHHEPSPLTAMGSRISELHRSFDLTADSPLFRAALFRFGDHERLFLVAHHLIIDGVSWRILLDELYSLYRGDELPPPTDPVRAWAEELARVRASATSHHWKYWRGVAQTPLEYSPEYSNAQLPCAGQVETCEVTLSAEHTRALLHDAHRAFRTRVDDVLLAALALTLRRWRGHPEWAIMVEGHGRDLPAIGHEDGGGAGECDVSRTIGWFTRMHPVVLRASMDDPAQLIKDTKEVLRDVATHAVYYEFLRWGDFHEQPELTNLAHALSKLQPWISFNYLGHVDQDVDTELFALADESAGLSRPDDSPPPFLLEVVAIASSGQLHVEWHYANAHFERDEMAACAAMYIKTLGELVEFASAFEGRELTVSDIDYDGFDSTGLDAFLEDL